MTDRAEKPIAVGDLVQVVRPSCCEASLLDARILGIPFKVVSLSSAHWLCRCGHEATSMMAYPDRKIGAGCDQAPVYTLRRVPPLDELESNDLCHPMKEPA